MNSLFDGIKNMVGSLLKLSGASAPRWPVGGRVSGEPIPLPYGKGETRLPAGHLSFDGHPLFGRGGPVGPREGHREFVIQIKMEPGRKRPITGDMAQMCQDLGIEPNTTMEDFRKAMEEHQKRIQHILAVPPLMIDRRWAR